MVKIYRCDSYAFSADPLNVTNSLDGAQNLQTYEHIIINVKWDWNFYLILSKKQLPNNLNIKLNSTNNSGFHLYFPQFWNLFHIKFLNIYIQNHVQK